MSKMPKVAKAPSYLSKSDKVYEALRKISLGVVAVIAGVAVCGAIYSGEAQACKAVPWYPSMDCNRSDFYDWELAIIDNKGWYTDSETGGSRYSISLATAYSIMTTGDPIVLYSKYYSDAEYFLNQFRSGLLTEADAMYMVNDGLFDELREGYPADLTVKSNSVKIWLSNGYMTEYIDQLKEAKVLEDTYKLPKTVTERNVKIKNNGKKVFTTLEAYEFCK